MEVQTKSGSGSLLECDDVLWLTLTGMERGEERFRALLKALVHRIVEALVTGEEGRTDVAPVGALGKVDHEIDVPAFPVILDLAGFLLGFKRLDLDAVGIRSVGDD